MSFRTPPGAGELAQFERSFAVHYADIARYCARRCADAHEAEDAATETFTVAWRRRADLPVSPGDRLWLFAIARRVLANQRRGYERRRRLLDRLHVRAAVVPDVSELVLGAGPAAGDVRAALERLSESHRELLLLSAWEGLSVGEIAEVLDVSSPVVSRRLHRARARFSVGVQFPGAVRPVGVLGVRPWWR